jgi:selenocysteine lyase/cysteine desulfurase
MQRRDFFRRAAGLALFTPDAIDRARAAGNGERRPAREVARDEDYWREIQAAFSLDRTLINLNNGGVSPSPRIVQDAMRRYLDFSNHAPVHTMWRVLEPQVESVRQMLARDFGCDPEELAITRNASEALETVQLGLDLKAGDEVITTDHDYPRMITTWKQRERRDGIKLKFISFPTPPPSLDDLYQRFEQAITPRTKVIHFCHITNVTGQIFPVARLCRMARERGIEAIVDGAHAYAQFPFRHADLDCDYYGTSLHKWLLAPHGTGFLYIRKSKIPKVWPLMAASDEMKDNVRKFEEIGTHPAANHNAIAEALTFHQTIGVDRKEARLRYLRSLWEERLGKLPKAKLLASRDPRMSAGIGMLAIEGKTPGDLHSALWEKYRIIVSPFTKPSPVEGIRITPNIYTTVEEIDRFCDAMEKIAV